MTLKDERINTFLQILNGGEIILEFVGFPGNKQLLLEHLLARTPLQLKSANCIIYTLSAPTKPRDVTSTFERVKNLTPNNEHLHNQSNA